MNILHIAPGYYDTGLYANLISSLNLTGVHSLIYIPKWSKKTTQGNNVYKIGKAHNKFEKLFYWGHQRDIFNDIVSRLPVKEIDVVHAHRLFFGGYAALRLKKKYNIDYIVAVRNTDVNYFLKYRLDLRKHALDIFLNAKRIIFLSSVYRDRVVKNYIPTKYRDVVLSKSEIITNGIDDHFLCNPLENERGHCSKTIHLVSVGDICKNKNQLTTLKSYRILKDKGYDVKLVFIGRITDEKYFNKIKFNEDVKYVPFCTKEEVLSYLREANIFVLPSKTETFGLVYAEAMTQRLPVIYTRGQGFDGQYINGEIGYSVEYNDYNGIAEAVLNIINNYTEISANCRNRAINYNWSVIAQKYKSIYEE